MEGRRQRQAGFTLLELMIGLVIFAMLILLINQASKLVLDLWGRGGQAMAREREILSCQRMVFGQIKSLVPYRPVGAPGRVLGLRGFPDRFTFVAPLAVGSQGQTGLWFVDYRLEPAAEGPGMDLVLRQWPAPQADWWLSDDPPAQGLVVLTGVTGLRFGYLRYQRQGAVWEESEEWTAGNQGLAPGVVAVYLELDGRSLRWEVPVACRND